MADQRAAILVIVGQTNICVSAVIIIHEKIHFDNRNRSHKTSEILWGGFQGQMLPKICI